MTRNPDTEKLRVLAAAVADLMSERANQMLTHEHWQRLAAAHFYATGETVEWRSEDEQKDPQMEQMMRLSDVSDIPPQLEELIGVVGVLAKRAGGSLTVTMDEEQNLAKSGVAVRRQVAPDQLSVTFSLYYPEGGKPV